MGLAYLMTFTNTLLSFSGMDIPDVYLVIIVK